MRHSHSTASSETAGAVRFSVFHRIFVLRLAAESLPLFLMSTSPPPNAALAELADVLGEDNVRTLVGTFLRDFPESFSQLSGGDRKTHHRIAHSLKSNSKLMGAFELSRRMADLEARLESDNGTDVTPQDLQEIAAEFATVAGPLQAFVGD